MERMEQEVAQTQQAFWSALQAKDAAQLDRLLDDDFLSVGRENQAKDDFIARLCGFPADVMALSGDAMQVHIFGEIAVLTTVQLAHLRLPDGRERVENLIMTNIFRHSADGWRMILAHPVETH